MEKKRSDVEFEGAVRDYLKANLKISLERDSWGCCEEESGEKLIVKVKLGEEVIAEDEAYL